MGFPSDVIEKALNHAIGDSNSLLAQAIWVIIVNLGASAMVRNQPLFLVFLERGVMRAMNKRMPT